MSIYNCNAPSVPMIDQFLFSLGQESVSLRDFRTRWLEFHGDKLEGVYSVRKWLLAVCEEKVHFTEDDELFAKANIRLVPIVRAGEIKHEPEPWVVKETFWINKLLNLLRRNGGRLELTSIVHLWFKEYDEKLQMKPGPLYWWCRRLAPQVQLEDDKIVKLGYDGPLEDLDEDDNVYDEEDVRVLDLYDGDDFNSVLPTSSSEILSSDLDCGEDSDDEDSDGSSTGTSSLPPLSSPDQPSSDPYCHSHTGVMSHKKEENGGTGACNSGAPQPRVVVPNHHQEYGKERGNRRGVQGHSTGVDHHLHHTVTHSVGNTTSTTRGTTNLPPDSTTRSMRDHTQHQERTQERTHPQNADEDAASMPGACYSQMYLKQPKSSLPTACSTESSRGAIPRNNIPREPPCGAVSCTGGKGAAPQHEDGDAHQPLAGTECRTSLQARRLGRTGMPAEKDYGQQETHERAQTRAAPSSSSRPNTSSSASTRRAPPTPAQHSRSNTHAYVPHSRGNTMTYEPFVPPNGSGYKNDREDDIREYQDYENSRVCVGTSRCSQNTPMCSGIERTVEYEGSRFTHQQQRQPTRESAAAQAQAHTSSRQMRNPANNITLQGHRHPHKHPARTEERRNHPKMPREMSATNARVGYSRHEEMYFSHEVPVPQHGYDGDLDADADADADESKHPAASILEEAPSARKNDDDVRCPPPEDCLEAPPRARRSVRFIQAEEEWECHPASKSEKKVYDADEHEPQPPKSGGHRSSSCRSSSSGEKIVWGEAWNGVMSRLPLSFTASEASASAPPGTSCSLPTQVGTTGGIIPISTTLTPGVHQRDEVEAPAATANTKTTFGNERRGVWTSVCGTELSREERHVCDDDDEDDLHLFKAEEKKTHYDGDSRRDTTSPPFATLSPFGCIPSPSSVPLPLFFNPTPPVVASIEKEEEKFPNNYSKGGGGGVLVGASAESQGSDAISRANEAVLCESHSTCTPVLQMSGELSSAAFQETPQVARTEAPHEAPKAAPFKAPPKFRRKAEGPGSTASSPQPCPTMIPSTRTPTDSLARTADQSLVQHQDLEAAPSSIPSPQCPAEAPPAPPGAQSCIPPLSRLSSTSRTSFQSKGWNDASSIRTPTPVPTIGKNGNHDVSSTPVASNRSASRNDATHDQRSSTPSTPVLRVDAAITPPTVIQAVPVIQGNYPPAPPKTASIPNFRPPPAALYPRVAPPCNHNSSSVEGAAPSHTPTQSRPSSTQSSSTHDRAREPKARCGRSPSPGLNTAPSRGSSHNDALAPSSPSSSPCTPPTTNTSRAVVQGTPIPNIRPPPPGMNTSRACILGTPPPTIRPPPPGMNTSRTSAPTTPTVRPPPGLECMKQSTPVEFRPPPAALIQSNNHRNSNPSVGMQSRVSTDPSSSQGPSPQFRPPPGLTLPGPGPPPGLTLPGPGPPPGLTLPGPEGHQDGSIRDPISSPIPDACGGSLRTLSPGRQTEDESCSGAREHGHQDNFHFHPREGSSRTREGRARGGGSISSKAVYANRSACKVQMRESSNST